MSVEELKEKISFADYCLKLSSESIDSLANLLQKKDEIISKNKENGEKIITLAVRLSDFLSADFDNENTKNFSFTVIKLLNKFSVENFINDPNNNNFYNKLAIQLYLLQFVFGNNDGFVPFTAQEMKEINAGSAEYYSDEAAFITLRKLIVNKKEAEGEIVNSFFEWLPKFNSGGSHRIEKLDWYEALFLFVIINVLWTNFDKLSENNKKILFTSFYYQSIMIGVDIEKKLENIVLSDDILGEILNNQEQVKLEEGEYRKFSDLFKIYIQKFDDAFNKETFLNKLYEEKRIKEKSQYIFWLRNALNTFYHLLIKASKRND